MGNDLVAGAKLVNRFDNVNGIIMVFFWEKPHPASPIGRSKAGFHSLKSLLNSGVQALRVQ